MPIKPRIFLMDTWAYPYRLPVFEALSKKVSLQLFFSKPIPFDHLDVFSVSDFDVPSQQGRLLLAYIPFHLIWEKYDAYFVGQIGVQSALGALFTSLVAKLRCKPLVLWTDYIETEYYFEVKPIKRFFGDIVRRLFVSQCSAAMAFGKYTADYLRKVTAGKLKIFEIKQVVPEVCNLSPPESERDQKYKDKVVVLCMSYMRPGKGVRMLLDAFKEINDQRAVLILCGTGKEQTHLQQLAAECAVQIEFPGFVDGLEKAKQFQNADLLVLPSEHETWGLVINEAMYYGLPIIVTDASGSHELIDGNGLVIPARNSVVLQDALRKLIDNEALRVKMGKKSQEIISQYGLEYGVHSFIQVINYVTQHKLV